MLSQLIENLSILLLLQFGLFKGEDLLSHRRAGCSRDNSPSQARLLDLQLAPAHPADQTNNEYFDHIDDGLVVVVVDKSVRRVT